MYGSHKLLQKSAGTRQLMAQNVHLPYVHKNEVMYAQESILVMCHVSRVYVYACILIVDSK